MANKAKTSKGAKAPTVKKSVQLVETDEAAKATKEAAIAAKKAEKASSLKALQGAKTTASGELKTMLRSSVGVENATTSNIVRIVAVSVAQTENLDGLNVLFHDGLRMSRSTKRSPKHASVFMKWADLRSLYCSTQYKVVKDASGVAVGANLLEVDEDLEVNFLSLLKDNEEWTTKGKEQLHMIEDDLFVYCKNIYTSWEGKSLGDKHVPVDLVDADNKVVATSVYLKNELLGFSDSVVASEEVDTEHTDVYEVAILEA